MHPKQKPQTKHKCTQRLIETHRHKHTQSPIQPHKHTHKYRNVRIKKNNQIHLKQFQYK